MKKFSKILSTTCSQLDECSLNSLIQMIFMKDYSEKKINGFCLSWLGRCTASPSLLILEQFWLLISELNASCHFSWSIKLYDHQWIILIFNFRQFMTSSWDFSPLLFIFQHHVVNIFFSSFLSRVHTYVHISITLKFCFDLGEK